MEEKEIWVDALDYEGIYMVSNFGNIMNIAKGFKREIGKILSKHVNKNNGYEYVQLTKLDGSRRNFLVHRLVLLSFKNENIKKTQVNHIDGNKTNNNLNNLEWVTKSENIQHAIKKGLIPLGENSTSSKLKEEDVLFIRKNLKIGCEEFGYEAMSKKFNITKSSICRIIKRKSWKHV